MANFHLIKTFAKQKEMTLAELAEAIGITPAGLTLIIKSGSTNTTTIENIARKLGVPVGAFFDNPTQENGEEVSELFAVIKQKDAIIAQKDKIIEQKDAIINTLISKKN